MTDKIVVLSTCETAEEADRIATALVENRLAACVNIVPGVRSVYRWKGAVEKADEFLLVIKTSRPLLEKAQAEIERIHSYDLPEAIALAVVDGSEQYLEWMNSNLGQEDEDER